MRTVVYYDQERTTSSEVEQAAARAGNGALHVRLADADWPEQHPAETLVSARDYTFRDQLMRYLDQLRQHLPAMDVDGVDLLEAIRYEWLFDVEASFHRVWALAKLLDEHRPDQIILVSRAGGHTDQLANYCLAQGTRLVTASQPLLRPIKQRVRQMVHAAKSAAYDCRAQLRQSTKPRESLDIPAAARRVVFSDYYANSAKLSLGVGQALAASHGVQVTFVAGREQVEAVFRPSGLPTYRLERFSALESRAAVDVARAFASAIEQLPPQEFAPLAGHPACQSYLMPMLRQTGAKALRHAATLLPKVRGMLSALEPKAVVTTTFASIFGRIHALAANAEGIASIYMQHGILGEGPFFSHLPFQHSLVWGESNRRSLVSAGTRPEQVRVIGAPNQDDIARWRSEPVAKDAQAGPKILFLASRAGGSVTSGAAFERILTSVLQASRAIPHARLIVKLHPADRTGIAQKVLANEPSVVLAQAENSLKLIHECDLAIVTSSTTGLEACALDCPLVVFTPAGIFHLVDYGRYGAAIEVSEGAALADALRRALGDDAVRDTLAQGRRRLVDDMLDGSRGDARVNAANAIHQILGE